MIRLFLLRHGNTFESNQTPTQVGAKSDLPLTLQGCEQAKNFSRYLLSEKISPQAIFSGALQRQRKTAEIIGEPLHLETRCEGALTEIDYGAWEGLTAEEIASKWPNEYLNWTHAGLWPEKIFKESLETHLTAIRSWLERLRKTFSSGDSVVGVTSNGVMRFFYSLLETEWRQLIQNRQMEKLKVKTGHFCELLLSKDAIQIQSWNAKP